MTSAATPTFVRLVYRSSSALAGSASDIAIEFDRILDGSCRRNSAEGVTGALMFTRHLFVQALEGCAEAVEKTFDRICCDARHKSVEIIEYGPVAERGFGDWSMINLVPDTGAAAMMDESTSTCEMADTAALTLKLMARLLRGSPEPPTMRTLTSEDCSMEVRPAAQG